ncbi:hypothetical protein BJV82DRAFT_326132 [Fennellomyces sp. T-0311]|nr:hypothetical protein BJV82DRAFT_326132 [Fennellomyces sp. T-0311]
MPSLPTLPPLSSLPLFSSLPTLSPTGVEAVKELLSFFFLSFYFVAVCMQPPRCNHPSPPPTSPSPPPTGHLPSPASPLPSPGDDDDAAVVCLDAASKEEEEVGAVRVRVPLFSIAFVEEDYDDIGDEEVAEEYDETDDAVGDLITQFARLSVFDTMDHLAERFSMILLLDEDIEMPQAKADEDIVMVRAPPLGPEHMVVDQRWPVVL